MSGAQGHRNLDATSHQRVAKDRARDVVVEFIHEVAAADGREREVVSLWQSADGVHPEAFEAALLKEVLIPLTLVMT